MSLYLFKQSGRSGNLLTGNSSDSNNTGSFLTRSNSDWNSLAQTMMEALHLRVLQLLFQQMLASGIRPGASISFIKQLCLQEQFLRHWTGTVRRKRKIYSTYVDSDIYSTLLIELSQKGHLVEAANVVSVMVEKRIQLKAPYLDNIAVLLSRIGEKELDQQLMSLK
ncbi:uncharacterized protein LOC113337966 [Papaver somniferum]|uniref:uncharacterized protein LOC113337966 n=1 Tax=Papaver somniferum TaxID=3469 RepID=UPI000E704AED|nr:uncharacterized protein LOC113337966 [Papaver somniferum]